MVKDLSHQTCKGRAVVGKCKKSVNVNRLTLAEVDAMVQQELTSPRVSTSYRNVKWATSLEMFNVCNGLDNADTATCLDKVASVRRHFGDLALARSLFECSLTLRVQTLGWDHPDTAVSLCNLFESQIENSSYDLARRYYDKAIAISQRTLASLAPYKSFQSGEFQFAKMNRDIIAGKFAGKYRSPNGNSWSGRGLTPRWMVSEMAEGNSKNSYLIAMTSSVELDDSTDQMASQSGEENLTRFARTLNTMGVLLCRCGAREPALQLFEYALAIRERTLGISHLSTALSMSNLAILYEDMGLYQFTHALFQKALDVCEKVLGPNNHEVALLHYNLGVHLAHLGEDEKAAHRFHKMAVILEKTSDHDASAMAMAWQRIGNLFATKGHLTLACVYFERAFSLRKKMLGDEDPETLLSQRSVLEAIRLVRSQKEEMF